MQHSLTKKQLCVINNGNNLLNVTVESVVPQQIANDSKPMLNLFERN
jgi:hypothetical protein